MAVPGSPWHGAVSGVYCNAHALCVSSHCLPSVSSPLFIYLFFKIFFFLMWTIFKVFIEFITIWLLFYVLFFFAPETSVTSVP